MTTSGTTLGAFDLSRVMKRTFEVLNANLGAFAVLALLTVTLPQAALATVQYFVAKSPSETMLLAIAGVGLVGWLASMIGAYVLEAAVLFASVRQFKGKPTDLGQAVSAGFSFVLPLFGLGILMGLAMLVGFVLFVVPGIMMLVAWVVAAPAIVVEKRGVTESFRRSADLTRGHRWAIFGLCLIYLAGYFIVSLAVGAVVGIALTSGLEMDLLTANSMTSIFVEPFLAAAGSLVGAAGVAAIYFELRSAKEGVGTADLASVFD